MWRSIPGGTWVVSSPGVDAGAGEIQIQADAAAPRKKRSEAPPPKVEETVGDLAFVVQNGEIKVEGVGLVDRAGEHRRRPAAVVVSHPARRRDEQGRGRARQQDAGQPPVLDGDRPDDDPDRGQPQGPARRRGRSAPGLRHEEPGRRLPDGHPAPRGAWWPAARPGTAPSWPSRRGR